MLAFILGAPWLQWPWGLCLTSLIANMALPLSLNRSTPSCRNECNKHSRIKGLGGPWQFSLEGPYDVFHDVIVCIIYILWFATFLIPFSSGWLCASLINSIVSRLWLQNARNGVENYCKLPLIVNRIWIYSWLPKPLRCIRDVRVFVRFPY